MSANILRDFNRAALPAVLVIAIGWYASARAHIPAASTVDGVYYNPCCGAFTMRNGVVLVGKTAIPFDVEDMKFGLTAFPKAQIIAHGGQVQAYQDNDPGPLLFDTGRTAVTVCGDKLCNRSFQFKRVSPLPNGS